MLKPFMNEEGGSMSSVTHFAETVQRILSEEADQLAREVGFVQRERVIRGADFVQSLLFGWLQEPEIAYDGLTQVLGRREVSITASGLSQRFTPEAACLLQRVLERLGAEQMEGEAVAPAPLQQFTPVLLEDCSPIPFPPPLAPASRGWGGRAWDRSPPLTLVVR